MPAKHSGINFINRIVDTPHLNFLNFLYMYNGGGVAVGDIDNDGLPDIYMVANQGINSLFLNKGQFRFEDITTTSGVEGSIGSSVWNNGVTMVDINADGWLDIYVCELDGYLGLKGKNKLFINNRDRTFTEQAASYGLDIRSQSQEANFFDFDLDGDLDMFLVSMSMENPRTYKPGSMRSGRDSNGADRLYENTGNGFVDVSSRAGIYGGSMGYGLSVSIADLNNDQYPDIYVTNDFYENDYLYFNKQNGTFEEGINDAIGHTSYFSMGSTIADFNNDGWMDIFTLDMKPASDFLVKSSFSPESFSKYKYRKNFGYHDQFSRNMLHQNAGILNGSKSRFREIGEMSGIDATDWSWSALSADFDLDGRKDMFITNGIPYRPNDLDYLNYKSDQAQDSNGVNFEQLLELMPSGHVANMAFRNMGAVFEDVSSQWGVDLIGCSNGAAYADLDNDGDLDLVMNNLNTPATIYRNTTRDEEEECANFLKIALRGSSSNPFGVGARVTLFMGDSMQMQELAPVTGWLSSIEPILLFGLGKSKEIDRLEVDWKDGRRQELRHPSVNTQIVLAYKHSKENPSSSSSQQKELLFSRATELEENIDFTHIENEYVDFHYEPLLPRMISTQGPRIAVGDINNDGLDDFYLGGAKYQAGAIFVQQIETEGSFKKVDNNIFYKDRAEEDVEAAFFDVNGDDLLDLYVVSGSGEGAMDYTGKDRLYLNRGNNSFSKSTQHPQLDFNGSCVTIGDFNDDGVTDLFVGGRSVPGSYGKYPASRILLGDGVGRVFDFTPKMFGNNFQLGMVTDAVWLAKTKELIVAGEWMPLTRVNFSSDTITIDRIQNTSGWWNTLHSADLDGDGDLDLLAGNLGANSSLKASPSEPVSLYVKDFDNNSTIDPIMTHYQDGVEVPFFGRDLIGNQLQPIRRLYPTYGEFASSPFDQIFNRDDLHGAGRWQVQTFSSMILLNEGLSGFTPEPLPIEAQYSPIYGFAVADFNLDGHQDILSVGNFYGNQVALGKFDASYGSFLCGSEDARWKFIENINTGFSVEGEARDIELVQTATGEVLVFVSRNDNSLVVYNTEVDLNAGLIDEILRPQ